MNILRPSVEKLGAYTVDQDLSVIKLNQNEAPEDVPAEVKEEVFERLRRAGWQRYPEGGPGELEERLSASTGCPVSGILVGNGSNELIQAIYLAVCAPGDRIVIVRPGFALFKRVASVLSLAADEVPLGKGFVHDADDILERARGARAVILASPNNPTGTALSVSDIERIVRSFDGLVVIDEAYLEFHGRTVQGLTAECPNLVVLRTLSKAWRLAGVRLGYLFGNAALVGGIAKTKLPFTVGTFARTVAEVMLDRREKMESVVRRVIGERTRVFEALAAIPGIVPVPSSANFILFGLENTTAAPFQKELKDRGVLVRSFDDPALLRHLRVTIGTTAENDVFLKAASDAVAEGRG